MNRLRTDQNIQPDSIYCPTNRRSVICRVVATKNSDPVYDEGEFKFISARSDILGLVPYILDD